MFGTKAIMNTYKLSWMAPIENSERDFRGVTRFCVADHPAQAKKWAGMKFGAKDVQTEVITVGAQEIFPYENNN